MDAIPEDDLETFFALVADLRKKRRASLGASPVTALRCNIAATQKAPVSFDHIRGRTCTELRRAVQSCAELRRTRKAV